MATGPSRVAFRTVSTGDGAIECAEGVQERGSGVSGGHVFSEAVGEALLAAVGAPAGDGSECQAGLSPGEF